jgi:hypothetical protein
MSRRKPIDEKILEAGKKFDADIFAETVKCAFFDEYGAISELGDEYSCGCRSSERACRSETSSNFRYGIFTGNSGNYFLWKSVKNILVKSPCVPRPSFKVVTLPPSQKRRLYERLNERFFGWCCI